MPVVPSYDGPRVAPSAPGANTFGTPSTSGGGDIAAQQIGQLGKGVQDAGLRMGQLVLQAQEEANNTRVQDAVNQLKTEQLALTTDPQRGFVTQRGQAALERESGMSLADEYGQQLDQTGSVIAEGLGNDAQREAFARARADVGLQFRASATTHEVREFETYKATVNAATAEVAGNTLAGGIFEPAYDETQDLAALRAAVIPPGSSPDSIEAKAAMLEATTKARAAAVAAALDANQPGLAGAYLDAHAADIAPLARFQLRAKVKDATDRADAMHFQTFLENADAGAEQSPVESGEVYSWPVTVGARVSSGQGPRDAPTLAGGRKGSTNHGGTDFAVPEGTRVSAAAPGVVIEADAVGAGGLGKYVRVRHPNGDVSTYAHLSRVGVKKDDPIAGGVVIGASGSTGNSTGPHLHFAVVDKDGKVLDPMTLLGKPLPGAPGAKSGMLAPGNLAEAYAAADLAAGDDPQRQARFRAAADEVYGRRRREEADREQAASDAVQPYLRPGAGIASWSQIPAGVWGALSEQQKTQIQNSFAAAAKAAAGAERETDMVEYTRLRGLASTGPKTFLALDPLDYINSLSDSDYKTMLGIRADILKGNPAAKTEQLTVSRAMGVAARNLKAVGLTEQEDPREFAQFQGKLMRAADDWRAANGGKVPDDNVLLGLTRELLRNVAVGNKSMRAYEVPAAASTTVSTWVPKDAAAFIRKAYAAKGKPPPTPQQLSSGYRDGLLHGIFEPPEK